MKKFIKTHKKQCLMGLIAFLTILFLALIWLFIIPLFSNNKYGDRLKNISQHEISSSEVEKIKKSLKENDKVLKVTYHKEGRILNFVITVDNSMSVDDAKKLCDKIAESIKKNDRKYYDIQVLIDSKEDSDNYPIAGYKNKNNDSFSFGNEVS